ncbi:MAG: hypothetical protein IIA61_14375 [Candidatus Marinimicrobia bacterium]|nr:hypothetical protein [Candidatus Neomarinimicrobiota bacterium]
MKWHPTPLILMTMFATVNIAVADDAKKELSDHLKPFAPYIGKTWKGEFVGSTPEKPIYDISRWERALNGNAIRIIHSVNNGQYGGESIVMWDAKKRSLVFWYFTTDGFYTQGTMMIGRNFITFTSSIMGRMAELPYEDIRMKLSV